VDSYFRAPFFLRKLTILNGLTTVCNLNALFKDLNNLREFSLLKPDVENEKVLTTSAEESSDQFLLTLKDMPVFMRLLQLNPKLEALWLDFRLTRNWFLTTTTPTTPFITITPWSRIKISQYVGGLKSLNIFCDSSMLYVEHPERLQHHYLYTLVLAKVLLKRTLANSLESLSTSYDIGFPTYLKLHLTCRNSITTIKYIDLRGTFNWESLCSYPSLTALKLTGESVSSTNFHLFSLQQLVELELIGFKHSSNELAQIIYQTRSKMTFLNIQSYAQSSQLHYPNFTRDLNRSIQYQNFEKITYRGTASIDKKNVEESCKRSNYNFLFQQDNTYTYTIELSKKPNEVTSESLRNRLVRSKTQILSSST
jgi:hypothetical protein